MSHPAPVPVPMGTESLAPRVKRWVKWGGLTLALALVLAPVLQTERGHRFALRSYLRVEEIWRRMPVGSGKNLIRSSEPFLARIGFFRPVWMDVEPGVRMLLDPSELVGRTVLTTFRTRWDPHIWDAISGNLCEGCVILDVGAHIGYFTLKSSIRVGPGGRIVAFEPNPPTVETLRANVAASKAANVTVVPVACTDKETTLTFFDASAGGSSVVSSLSRENAGRKAREITVPGRMIDNVAKELGLTRVDLLKVDVEGAELLVLRGAQEVLRKHHPKLVLEVVPHHLGGMNTTVEQLFAFVKEMGYTRGTQIADTDWVWTAD